MGTLGYNPHETKGINMMKEIQPTFDPHLLDEIPEEVSKAASILHTFFEQKGVTEWEFEYIADRRIAHKLRQIEPKFETPQAQAAYEFLMENLKLMDKKQKDYGSKNISANPTPEYAVAIRANDKVQRLMNLLYDSKEPQNEPVVDAWKDLVNYGLIGLLVHEGKWE